MRTNGWEIARVACTGENDGLRQGQIFSDELWSGSSRPPKETSMVMAEG